MSIYMIEQQMFKRPAEHWQFKHNFEASHPHEAAYLAEQWAKYHGIDCRDVRIAPTIYPDIIPVDDIMRGFRK